MPLARIFDTVGGAGRLAQALRSEGLNRQWPLFFTFFPSILARSLLLGQNPKDGTLREVVTALNQILLHGDHHRETERNELQVPPHWKLCSPSFFEVSRRKQKSYSFSARYISTLISLITILGSPIPTLTPGKGYHRPISMKPLG